MEHDIGSGDSVGHKDFVRQEHPFLKHVQFSSVTQSCLTL